MHMLQSLFYLTIAQHISDNILTHLQEHKTGVTTASVTVTPYCCTHTPPTAHSNQFQLFHDSNRQQYGVTVTDAVVTVVLCS